MWRLIKSEISYYKPVLLGLYIAMMPFFIINIFVDNFEKSLAQVMFVSLPVMAIFVNQEEKKSKKNPLYIKLPLSITQIGIFRLVMFISFWISLSLLFTMSTLLGSTGKIELEIIWKTLILMSSMICYLTLVVIMQDFRYCFRKKLITQFLAVLYPLVIIIVAIIYLILVYSDQARELLVENFFTPFASFTFLVISLILIIISVIVFNRRKIYFN